jgi:hypothetical protein
MKYLIAILSLAALLGFSACGYKEGVATGAQKSYLYFTGDVTDVTVSVDEGVPFNVKSGRDNQYKIEPGKHIVKVYRNNTMTVQREIFVSDGIAKEIEVR